MNVEKIESEGDLLATIIRFDSQVKGFEVATDPDAILQVGINQRDAGEFSKIHLHPRDELLQRSSNGSEIIHVVFGLVEIQLTNASNKHTQVVLLKAGDTAILYAAHGVRYLEKTRVLEIKEGPYPGPEKDKIFLNNR
jgi:hypothetical protein